MKKKDFGYISVIILLIIIFIIIFFSFKTKRNNSVKPTGNVDIFDINIKCDYVNEKLEEEDKNIDTNAADSNTKHYKQIKQSKKCVYKDEKGNEKEVPSIHIDDSKDEFLDRDGVFVDDLNGDYIYQNKIDIFNNLSFNYTNKIAPGTYNTYDFKVHNSSDMKLNYKINLSLSSEYKLNIKYRIRRNNKYIVGNENTYVSFEDISIPIKSISTNKYDDYSLDWKWFDDDENDTIAGINMNSEYNLGINITFEQEV